MPVVLRENSLKWRGKKFLWRQLVLLGEQNNSLAVDEPLQIDVGFEEDELLKHSVLGAVFKKDSIVARDVACEDNSIHVLEHVNPFSPLAPEAAKIEELIDSIVMNDSCLPYTSGLCSGIKDILDGGNIIRI